MKRDYASLLPRLLETLFPDIDVRQTVKGQLIRFGHRVQVGILKASNGDLEEINRLVNLATHDWRDLLVEAEYPLSFGKDKLREANPEKYHELMNKEIEEYDNWLKEKLEA